MTFRIEIDERGRVWLPPDVLEALRLAPGSVIEMTCQPGEQKASFSAASSAPAEPHLLWEKGLLVIDGLPSETMEETRAALRAMREERGARFDFEPVHEAA